MSEGFRLLPDGTVTSPRGFRAGAVRAGIRTDVDRLDLGILCSEVPCTAAAVYTSNNVKAAPLIISREHLSDCRAQAVIANSGCANAGTGEVGMRDARAMAERTSARLGMDPSDVLVASTGVIGTYLPMQRITESIPEIEVSTHGGTDFAHAIMTTDSRPKYVAAHFQDGGRTFTLGGVAKGAGMIHPNMATMLCFLTTDAEVEFSFLDASLRAIVSATFNMIDVDNDTSTNDTVAIMANGLAGGGPIDDRHSAAASFRAALFEVCRQLARAIVEDAEGATKVIGVDVEGAASPEDAQAVAKEVVRSVGVKTAIYGHDPNWGRILAAVGNSGALMEERQTVLWLADQCLFRGEPQGFDVIDAKAHLTGREVRIRVQLGMGDGRATAWGSDITEEYIRRNSQYTT